MSYRSIKHVLGETSLERKCRFLFGACLLLLITASFWWYGNQTEKVVSEQNRNTGRLLVDQVMQVQHWKSLESSEHFRPVTKALADSFSKQPHEARFILPERPSQPRPLPERFRAADNFERQLLEYFQKQRPAKTDDPEAALFAERTSSDGNQYYYYQPVYAQSLCFASCHRPPLGSTGLGGFDPGMGNPLGYSTAESDGELMALVQVTIPTGPTQRAINWNRAILLSTAIITVFLAMVASYVIVRYVIVKPLRHLRYVSDAISRGNIALRAEIHTGDEFEELAVAFNRMLRHLVTIQEELRQANATLDLKVDELAQVNMRLYELNSIKSDFLATMSHELRTPLNSILGFGELLASADSLTDKQKRYVQNILSSGRQLLEMINDILDLAKIESGKMELRPTEFAPQALLASQCDMARPLTERKNIDLELCIDAEMPPMYQDQARVQQILNNLLSNAIKFTPEGGRIVVSARRDQQDFFVLQVSDTGVGIAPEDQQIIFEKFRQGRTAIPTGDPMTREHSGTGLGLSIVKELCKLMGGSVSVQSELGKGSTFTVRLPWRLEEQPKLDSPLVEGFEEFTRSRFELLRERASSPKN